MNYKLLLKTKKNDPMVQINLSEFSNYELTQLLGYIALHNENEYNITFPKKTTAGLDGNFLIAHEYLDAAYVGQQLCHISTSFSYSVPCVKNPHYFSFQITINDMIKLAVMLHFLAKVLYNKTDAGLVKKYNHSTSLLLEDAFDGKKDTACWELIWVANLFLCKG